MKSVYLLLLIIVIASSKRAIHNQQCPQCSSQRSTCGNDASCRQAWNNCIKQGPNDKAIQACLQGSQNQNVKNYEKCVTANCLNLFTFRAF